MPTIEGIRIKNYGVLKDVTLGCVLTNMAAKPLTPLVAVIGKNGTGKSTIFDAFAFVSDCLRFGIEEACFENDRRGFLSIRSKDVNEPIEFEITYRDSQNSRSITYILLIDYDQAIGPYILKERLFEHSRRNAEEGSYTFLDITNGKGKVWADDLLVDVEGSVETSIMLVDRNMPAVTTLGALKEHPRITQFRNFIQSWYLCSFSATEARELPLSGAQKHLNKTGSNLSNVIQYMEQVKGKKQLKGILESIAAKIPGISSIYTKTTDDGRLLLCFQENGFDTPHYVQNMSDGTIKLVAYMVLLEDTEIAPFICLEEPENGLYHNLLTILAAELRELANQAVVKSQLFITTHSPYFLNALSSEDVWFLEKGVDGFSRITRASDIMFIEELSKEIPLGDLWYSDYFERR